MYLDPGFGGMLFQVVVAIIAMGGILVFSLRRKIRALFSKNKDAGGKTAGIVAPADIKTDAADDAIDMLSDEPSDESSDKSVSSD